MKLLYLLLFVSSISFSQTSVEKKTFFVQCALTNLTAENYIQLENQLKANSAIFVIRVDPLSNTLFLLTQERESFSVTDFDVWMGAFAQNSSCLNIGIRGVDVIKPNPKQGCDE